MATVFAKEREFTATRLKCGHSLASLAAATGLTKETVFRIERGRSVRPRNATKICAALNVAFDDIFVVAGGET